MTQIRVPYYLTPSLSPAGLTPIPLPTPYPYPPRTPYRTSPTPPLCRPSNTCLVRKKAYPPDPSTAPPPLRSRHLPAPSPLSTALPVHLPLPPSLPLPRPPSLPSSISPPLPHTLPRKNLVSFVLCWRKRPIGRGRAQQQAPPAVPQTLLHRSTGPRGTSPGGLSEHARVSQPLPATGPAARGNVLPIFEWVAEACQGLRCPPMGAAPRID